MVKFVRNRKSVKQVQCLICDFCGSYQALRKVGENPLAPAEGSIPYLLLSVSTDVARSPKGFMHWRAVDGYLLSCATFLCFCLSPTFVSIVIHVLIPFMHLHVGFDINLM